MPFPMKIQPIDFAHSDEGSAQNEPIKPVVKSRLKRLIERQFHSVLRITTTVEKTGAEESHYQHKDSSTDFEPSSVCLSKMVQNFIEGGNEKQFGTVRCGRKRCNCFNGSCSDSSEEEYEISSSSEAWESFKGLVPCPSLSERNLLADTAKIIEKNKTFCKSKDDCRKMVVESLLSLGYDASVCISKWTKSASYLAGEYEYVDVIIDGERLLIDVDFRSEFEIARSTKTYKSVLQSLPYIFVGKTDRLEKIISIVAEAAKQSLKKKGMPLPPWRKADYVRAKWLSPYTRITPNSTDSANEIDVKPQKADPLSGTKSSSDESEFLFGEKPSPVGSYQGDSVFSLSTSFDEEEKKTMVAQWEPPEMRSTSSQFSGTKIVTGLSSVFEDKP